MPTVGGNMYPELPEQMHDPKEFNVLALGELTADHLPLLSKLDVLHNYIQDRGNGTRIRLHGLKSQKQNAIEKHESATVHSFDLNDYKSVAALLAEADIDVVLDPNRHISDKVALENDDRYVIVRDMVALEAQCEIFLVGRDIPWTFNDAMWNMTWFARYYMRPGLVQKSFYFMNEAAQIHGHTAGQVDRVRYLTNRIGQIEYCRDTLNSLLQKKRRAFRHGRKDQDYSFELNYHLSNYYFLISGGLDIIARILNDIFALGLTSFSALGLEKNDFSKALKKKHSGLAGLYGEKKVKEWIEWLKERRNFIAHEAGMSHTPLVEEKKVKMTPEELERKIDKHTDWTMMRAVLTPEQYQAQRQMVKNIVQLDDYEEVAKDVMVVRSNGNSKLFMPLRNIDYDYDHFHDIVSKTIENLQAER